MQTIYRDNITCSDIISNVSFDYLYRIMRLTTSGICFVDNTLLLVMLHKSACALAEPVRLGIEYEDGMLYFEECLPVSCEDRGNFYYVKVECKKHRYLDAAQYRRHKLSLLLDE